MATLGVNVGYTGSSLIAEAMIAFRGASTVAGAVGKEFSLTGGFGSAAKGAAGANGANVGGGWFMKGGLAGMTSRVVTNKAVQIATSTTSAVHTASACKTSQADRTVRYTQAARSSRSDQVRSVAHKATSAVTKAVTSVATLHRNGIGGTMFNQSIQTGGQFANDVIGRVARGDIRSTGSMTGEMAAQAMMSYTGQTALGDTATQKISFSDVEIGGGRITGTEITPEHPEGMAFGMYHVDQYAAPKGDYTKVFTADGTQWYKQYATDTVVQTPYQAPDGEVDYHKEIVKKLPDPPKRKDRL